MLEGPESVRIYNKYLTDLLGHQQQKSNIWTISCWSWCTFFNCLIWHGLIQIWYFNPAL